MNFSPGLVLPSIHLTFFKQYLLAFFRKILSGIAHRRLKTARPVNLKFFWNSSRRFFWNSSKSFFSEISKGVFCVIAAEILGSTQEFLQGFIQKNNPLPLSASSFAIFPPESSFEILYNFLLGTLQKILQGVPQKFILEFGCSFWKSSWNVSWKSAGSFYESSIFLGYFMTFFWESSRGVNKVLDLCADANTHSIFTVVLKQKWREFQRCCS